MSDNTKKPAWWTDKISASWEVAKNLAVTEWKKVATDSKKMKDDVMEGALAFGHGARQSFSKFGAWTDEVERKLGEEWQRVHHDASESWEKVRDTVKHEWERVRAKQAAAGGDKPATETPPAEPPKNA
jgi:hypothetical protein